MKVWITIHSERNQDSQLQAMNNQLISWCYCCFVHTFIDNIRTTSTINENSVRRSFFSNNIMSSIWNCQCWKTRTSDNIALSMIRKRMVYDNCPPGPWLTTQNFPVELQPSFVKRANSNLKAKNKHISAARSVVASSWLAVHRQQKTGISVPFMKFQASFFPRHNDDAILASTTTRWWRAQPQAECIERCFELFVVVIIVAHGNKN